MANEEHLAKLWEGVKAWNQWRNENPEIKPNLSSACFSDANLKSAHLKSAHLIYAELAGAELAGANLLGAELAGANLLGANLAGANLEGANLAGANLEGAILEGAILRLAELAGAKLAGVNLAGANLEGVNLSNINLTGVNLEGANLEGANLEGANLSNTNLTGVNLESANLTDANLNRNNLLAFISKGGKLKGVKLEGINLSNLNLKNVILEDADLQKVQALGTNFEDATLTGACIEDWNINSQTNLQNVKCDYIYLKKVYSEKEKKWIFSERRPHDPNKNFALGEFTKLFQKALETVDLIFSEGIEWAAFLESFQQLQAEIKSEELSIQAIEKRSGGAFVVRVDVPPEANKAEIQKYIEREYKSKLKVIEASYQKDLNAKEEQIAIYRQQNTNLNEIVKLLANKPINIHNVQVDKGNYNENIKGDYSE